ncbi:MAG: polysaccharide deacetylase family protein [Alphaproteobacteria bacterium]|nr:polysaccharide deacetylase family protein [Alphaproteobacteria bacterium]
MPNAIARRRADHLRAIVARCWFARPTLLTLDEPIISFNFDDFPQSAVDNAVPILARHGLHATFYLSTSLFGYEDHAGRYVEEEAVQELIAGGHDIGCHTHGHLDVLHCSTRELEADLERYRRAFAERYGDDRSRTFSYPYGRTNLFNKRFLARHFELLRGIRTGINQGLCDLAHLRANELAGPSTIERALALVEENLRRKGLLIFFTHDVADPPSNHGCRPADFEKVVSAAVASGARIMTMDEIAAKLSKAKRSEGEVVDRAGEASAHSQPKAAGRLATGGSRPE